MTLEKKFKGAPFGIQAHRFDSAAVHPKRKMPGTLLYASSDTQHLGPGCYDGVTEQLNAFSATQLQQKASGPGWKRAMEMERLATMPHLLYREQWEQKKNEKRKQGPGSYDIPTFIDDMNYKITSKVGSLSTLDKRFKDSFKEETPAPGIYGRGGDPHAFKEEMERSRKTGGQLGLLENGGNGQRSLPLTGSKLGPGTYTLKASVDLLSEKVVGNRGPYDLFSLDRNKPIKTGHLAHNPSHCIGPGAYELSSFVSDLHTSARRHQGKFLKTVQYQPYPRDPENQLSPVTYKPSYGLIDKQDHCKKAVPFQSTGSRSDKRSEAFFTQNFNSVGAGRYDIQKILDNQHINSHINVFISKTRPRLDSKEQAFLGERLRVKDIPDTRKVRVDHISTEASPCADLSAVHNVRPLVIT